jgi:cell division protein FtsI/penicillin-binding protein 2
MLAETEDVEGTGRHAAQANPGLHICGKTGTAQIQDVHGNLAGHTTWFASFAPFEKPRWAVVVMVEDGISGGETCSRVAGPIYKAIVENDQKGQPTTVARTP